MLIHDAGGHCPGIHPENTGNFSWKLLEYTGETPWDLYMPEKPLEFLWKPLIFTGETIESYRGNPWNIRRKVWIYFMEILGIYR